MIYQNAFSSVFSLLNSNSLFIVPTFQRPFRWKERHIETLVTDINEARNAQRDHYLSPIHLIEINTTNQDDVNLLNNYTNQYVRPNIYVANGGLLDDAGFPVSVYLVIDGQQRLAAVLAVLKAFNTPMAYSVMIGGQAYPKLIAGSVPEDAQIRNGLGLPVLGLAYPNNAAAIRIQNAFVHAANLAAANPNIQLFTPFLQQRLKTLPVCLDAPYALGSFLTLNDRGEKLTTLEKLKAHCIYLDSLTSAPNPLNVHGTFGLLYQSLENTSSLLSDETTVQVATLFFLQGNYNNTEVVYWGAETCFERILSIDLNTNNLGSFLANITQIAIANNLLVAGLRDPATKGDFYLALKQRQLTHRALAIVMQFATRHNLTAPDLARPAGNILLNSNVDIANYLHAELARLGNPPPVPVLLAFNQQITADLNNLRLANNRSISVLELAVMVDACGVKAASFLWAWNQAFAIGVVFQYSCNSWAGYLEAWSSRFRYLRDLLLPGDVSPSSHRYKIALLKDVSNGRYWPAGRHSVEHIFPTQMFGINLPAGNPYGFGHIADYQSFCNRIGNILPLDLDLNRSIGANTPTIKRRHYVSQTTLNGTSVVPPGMTPATYSPTAVQLGGSLAGLCQVDEKWLIELRNFEMVCFAATVI